MNTKGVNVPGWVWWSTVGSVTLIIAITTLGAILLARGAADPPVAGPIIWSDADLTWANGPMTALGANESAWFAAPEAAHLPSDAFTLTVSARITPESDPGTAWGVWLEIESGARVIYAISGEGYTTTRRCDTPTLFLDSAANRVFQAIKTSAVGAGLAPPGRGGVIEDCPALRPEWRWMPYPRVHPPGATNTITLHVETAGSAGSENGSEVRLRLNREIMGAAAIRWSGRWGVWLRGGRASRASGVAGTILFIDAALRN